MRTARCWIDWGIGWSVRLILWIDWIEGYCFVSLIGVILDGVMWEEVIVGGVDTLLGGVEGGVVRVVDTLWGGVVTLLGGVEGGVVKTVDTLRGGVDTLLGGVEGGSVLLLDGTLADCEDFLAVSFSNRFASSGKGHTVGVGLALIENLLEGTNGSLEAHL